jgi:hypothetical protein
MTKQRMFSAIFVSKQKPAAICVDFREDPGYNRVRAKSAAHYAISGGALWNTSADIWKIVF